MVGKILCTSKDLALVLYFVIQHLSVHLQDPLQVMDQAEANGLFNLPRLLTGTVYFLIL